MTKEINESYRDEVTVAEKVATNKKDYTMIVTEYLMKLGVPTKLKGYAYLREAILMCIDDSDVEKSIISKIYPEIAKKYGSTADRVVRNIRTVLKRTWERGNIKYINELFSNTKIKDKPTNGRFIAFSTEKIRMQNAEKGTTTENKYNSVIADYFIKIGIPVSVNGYSYLKDAIIIAIDNPNLLEYELYLKIAEKYMNPVNEVKRNMQYAIKVAWLRGNIEYIKELFGYTVSEVKVIPRNIEIISFFADKIRLENH